MKLLLSLLNLNRYLAARKCLENIFSAMKDLEKSPETNEFESFCSPMKIYQHYFAGFKHIFAFL